MSGRMSYVPNAPLRSMWVAVTLVVVCLVGAAPAAAVGGPSVAAAVRVPPRAEVSGNLGESGARSTPCSFSPCAYTGSCDALVTYYKVSVDGNDMVTINWTGGSASAPDLLELSAYKPGTTDAQIGSRRYWISNAVTTANGLDRTTVVDVGSVLRRRDPTEGDVIIELRESCRRPSAGYAVQPQDLDYRFSVAVQHRVEGFPANYSDYPRVPRVPFRGTLRFEVQWMKLAGGTLRRLGSDPAEPISITMRVRKDRRSAPWRVVGHATVDQRGYARVPYRVPAALRCTKFPPGSGHGPHDKCDPVRVDVVFNSGSYWYEDQIDYSRYLYFLWHTR